ncbi:MAG: ROK family transcriptional regulator [Devosia sp.]|nr:ROK family transcriptional regulator [Devosia sp.]
MRRTNAILVLDAIRAKRGITRVELARATGLSRPTVYAIVSALLGQGYVRELDGTSQKQDRPGPRATTLAFVPDVGFVLGLDLGATALTVLVADLDGNQIFFAQRPIEKSVHINSPSEYMAALTDFLGETLAKAKLTRSQLWAVGVSVPGHIDQERGSFKLANIFVNWRNVPIRDLLGALFECPVVIENEVQLSILAEQRWGDARNVDNAIYLHLGTGLGMGLLLNGEIFRGADGFAGEIGFMDIRDPDTPAPFNSGSFEWAAGGAAYARLGAKVVEREPTGELAKLAEGKAENVDAQLVFSAARLGDRAAEQIVDQLTARLAVGIANICCVLNPEIVILGAGLSQAGDQLLGPLKHRVAELIPLPPRRITVSKLRGRSAILGAVVRALRNVEERSFRVFETMPLSVDEVAS